MKQVSHGGPPMFQSSMRQGGQISNTAASGMGEQIEKAILKTILYSDLFDYPLVLGEIAHYLVELPGNEEQIRTTLRAPVWLNGQITLTEEYVTLRGREHLVNRRLERARTSNKLWRKARFYCRVLSGLPFVRMVAVTGALAMDNSNANDDIDVLIVTAPNRVWLSRALAIILVHAGKMVPNTLCPNYVISQEALAVGPRTIYVAHEFVQMVPIYGCETYRGMRAANSWVEKILPNAGSPLHREPEYRPGPVMRYFKSIAEWLLSGKPGDWLDAWEMRRKIRKFSGKAAGAGGNVILDRSQVKGHFDDHGTLISSRYYGRLEEYHLDPPEKT